MDLWKSSHERYTYETARISRSAYLRECQKGSRQGGGYAQQVVHQVLVSALLSHVYQHLVEVDRAHLAGGAATLPRLNSSTARMWTFTAAVAVAMTTTNVHDATVAWYTFELHGMTAVAHPRRQPRRITNARFSLSLSSSFSLRPLAPTLKQLPPP